MQTAPETITAGIFLLIFSTLITFLYALIAVSLFGLARSKADLGLLVSLSVAEIGIVLYYGVISGFQMIINSNFIPAHLFWISSVVFNIFWFSMSYHYSVIATSRFVAIWYYTRADDIFTPLRCFIINALTWLLSIASTVGYHVAGFQDIYFDFNQWGFTQAYSANLTDILTGEPLSPEKWREHISHSKIFWSTFAGFSLGWLSILYAFSIKLIWQKKIERQQGLIVFIISIRREEVRRRLESADSQAPLSEITEVNAVIDNIPDITSSSVVDFKMFATEVKAGFVFCCKACLYLTVSIIFYYVLDARWSSLMPCIGVLANCLLSPIVYLMFYPNVRHSAKFLMIRGIKCITQLKICN